ncbi:MAG: hypothetical protein FWF79_01080, partial [Defluviitaleaceae bacterium]|nr:hypothetical protein [Defluviitaleaceae bacterium]
ALWHVDTVKNMAGMIGEPILAKIASDVANSIENGEIPTRLLEMLNQELTTVLTDIPEADKQIKQQMTEDDAAALMETLQTLLQNDSADAMFLTEKLNHLPESEDLVQHIENFNFPAALEALAKLRSRFAKI